MNANTKCSGVRVEEGSGDAIGPLNTASPLSGSVATEPTLTAVGEEAAGREDQNDADLAEGGTAEAEEDEDPNTVDEGTALLLRVAETETLSLLKRDRHRRDIRRRSAQARLLASEKQAYAALVESLKGAHAAAERAKPMSRSTLEDVHAQLAHTPELSALLLRLSSYIYRTEAVQAHIAVSKQWNQQLTFEKQLAQHSRLRELDTLLAEPVKAIGAGADERHLLSGSSLLPPSSAPLSSSTITESLRLSADSWRAMRSAVSQMRDQESRAHLESLLDVWETLLVKAESRTAALAAVTACADDAEHLVDTALRANPLWEILESQHTLHHSAWQATSTLLSREEDLLRQNAELKQLKGSLELALATASATATLAQVEHAHDGHTSTTRQTDPFTSPKTEESLRKQLRLIRASVTSKQEQRDAVARELVVLRRAVRASQVDLAQGSDAAAESGGVPRGSRLAEADAVLVRSLLTRVTQQVSDAVKQWDTALHGVTHEGRNEQVLPCDEALAQVESQQQALNALVAANTVLWQQVQDIHLAALVAPEPEKASNLAEAVLLQCGASWGPKQPEEGREDDASLSTLTSLRDLEARLVACFESAMNSVADRVTEALAQLEVSAHRPWRQLLHDTDTLSRVVHARVMREAAIGARGGPADAGMTMDTNRALRHLREVLRECSQRPAVLSHLPRTADVVSISSLSSDSRQATCARLAAASEQAQSEVQNTWASLEDDASTLSESLQWYAMHPLDNLDADTAAARERHEQLQHRARDAAASHTEKEQARRDVATLSAQLETLHTHVTPTLRASLADVEREVAALEARAHLWALLREEQQHRHEAVMNDESAEFHRIHDVFDRVLAALTVAHKPPVATANPSGDAAAVKSEGVKNEMEVEEEAGEFTADHPVVKEEASEAAEKHEEAATPTTLLADTFDAHSAPSASQKATDSAPLTAMAPGLDEEGTLQTDEMPIKTEGDGSLAPPFASRLKEEEDATALTSETRAPVVEDEEEEKEWEDEEEEAVGEYSTVDAVGVAPLGDAATTPMEAPGNVSPADDNAPRDGEENGDDGILSLDGAHHAVKQEQGNDDPFFSGFGFGDD